MASYYPEGECFFVRSSLNYAGNWSAGDTNQFYSHVLLEYSWNQSRAINQTQRSHPRSQWKSGKAQWYNTTFGDWDRFYVGESRDRNPNNMLAVTSHPNSLNWNECRDLDSGGPRKYILRPVKIRDPSTQWLWIDATIPLRAIYFPVSQTTDEAFQNLCTYVVIDFKNRTGLDLVNVSAQSQSLPISITQHNGLGWNDDLTWGFKIPDIISYLSIPYKLRNPEQGLFRTKTLGDELVVCAQEKTWTSSSDILHADHFFREMDMAKVLSATFGVEVGWRPYEYSSFIGSLITQMVGLGLAFVPGVGPLLSVGFGMAVQLLQDPTSFSHENVLDLGAAVLDSLLQSSTKSKKYLAPDFLPKGLYDGQQRQIPLTEEERARRKELGDELNARLSEELGRNLVIRSLLEQALFLQGTANADDNPIEEVEAIDPDAESN